MQRRRNRHEAAGSLPALEQTLLGEATQGALDGAETKGCHLRQGDLVRQLLALLPVACGDSGNQDFAHLGILRQLRADAVPELLEESLLVHVWVQRIHGCTLAMKK